MVSSNDDGGDEGVLDIDTVLGSAVDHAKDISKNRIKSQYIVNIQKHSIYSQIITNH
jgi:hypothetical protein